MANNLHVTYDLISPDQNYAAVQEKVKSLGPWAKVSETFWYVNTPKTASEARDVIKSVMDANDKLYVVDASNNSAAWHGISNDVSTFVRNNWGS